MKRKPDSSATVTPDLPVLEQAKAARQRLAEIVEAFGQLQQAAPRIEKRYEGYRKLVDGRSGELAADEAFELGPLQVAGRRRTLKFPALDPRRPPAAEQLHEQIDSYYQTARELYAEAEELLRPLGMQLDEEPGQPNWGPPERMALEALGNAAKRQSIGGRRRRLELALNRVEKRIEELDESPEAGKRRRKERV